MAEILGIDIGGTGVKGAIVNTITGELLTDRIKYPTPQPSLPDKVAEVVNQIIDELGYSGTSFGCGFPAIVKKNICRSAANIDRAWLDLNLKKYFCQRTGLKPYFVNDADAAGLAEIAFGRGKGHDGTVIMITLGTGIGSGIFSDGKLLPNTELGHLLYKDSVFEHYASNNARKSKELSWEAWGQELSVYLNHLNLLFSPDLIILGGGVSKKFDLFHSFLDVICEIVPAQLQNNAGIIGAAISATES